MVVKHMVDTTTRGYVRTVAVDAEGTVALNEFDRNVNRALEVTFAINPEADIDVRVDAGAAHNDDRKPETEDDVVWYEAEGVSVAGQERFTVTVTEQFARLVVVTPGAAGTEAEVLVTAGR